MLRQLLQTARRVRIVIHGCRLHAARPRMLDNFADFARSITTFAHFVDPPILSTDRGARFQRRQAIPCLDVELHPEPESTCLYRLAQLALVGPQCSEQTLRHRQFVASDEFG